MQRLEARQFIIYGRHQNLRRIPQVSWGKIRMKRAFKFECKVSVWEDQGSSMRYFRPQESERERERER